MSDVDRLRKAADTVERLAIEIMDPIHIRHLDVPYQKEIASLLRAVAEYQGAWNGSELPCNYCYADQGKCESDCPNAAALALADSILGAGDE